MDDRVLENSQHPELSKLCEDCTPVELKEEVEKYCEEFKNRCNKLMEEKSDSGEEK